MSDRTANSARLAAHWEPGGGRDHEERIERLERQVACSATALRKRLKPPRRSRNWSKSSATSSVRRQRK